jgi:hypothetical protein
MRINIATSALACPDNHAYLDGILMRMRDGAHDWEIPSEHIDEFLDSEWLSRQDSYQRKFFEESAKFSTYPYQGIFERKLLVAAEPTNDGELSAELSCLFANEPLYVLMENKFTDGKLLNLAIKFLGSPNLQRLTSNLALSAIEYVSAGGNGELPKHIEHLINTAAAKLIPIRIVVFTDSDSHFPGDIDRNAELVVESCVKNSIPYCMLTKKSIENYIPDDAFLAWKDEGHCGEKIDAFLSLSTEQRDFFPLKKGITGSRKPELFADLDAEAVALLKKRIAKEPIDLLDTYATKLTADSIRQRDHARELEHILELIRKEI